MNPYLIEAGRRGGEQRRQRLAQDDIGAILERARGTGDYDQAIEEIITSVPQQYQGKAIEAMQGRQQRQQSKEALDKVQTSLNRGGRSQVQSEVDGDFYDEIARLQEAQLMLANAPQTPQVKAYSDQLQNQIKFLSDQQKQRAERTGKEDQEIFKANLQLSEKFREQGATASDQLGGISESLQAVRSGNTSGFYSRTYSVLNNLGLSSIANMFLNRDMQTIISNKATFLPQMKQQFGSNVSTQEMNRFFELLAQVGTSQVAQEEALRILAKGAAGKMAETELIEDEMLDDLGKPVPNFRKAISSKKFKDKVAKRADEIIKPLFAKEITVQKGTPEGAIEELKRRGYKVKS